FLIWGVAMYLWSGVLYLIQVGLVVRQMPKRGATPAGRR
ncbi:MAG: CDP-diacylglycerol--glycerol-3-phosphate 3-phosphatidyltransferase, partial [Mycolicibacterium hassiacum]|nr:CDP-diacylglycerol--glycerol-3-phosphate 3-phosphatidyltransferase [Mycolicibacterium hassiacum]